ncbi:MAG: O-antigen ligase family protein [Bacteroidota bacterium]
MIGLDSVFARARESRRFQISLIIGVLIICSIISAIVATSGVTGGALVVLVVVAPLAIFSVVNYPKFGVMFFLIVAYVLMFFYSMGLIAFPLGTIMDGLLALLLIGFFINQKTSPNWEIFNNSITWMICVWLGYNLLEVVNPAAESKLAWLFTIRSLALLMMSYFVFMYNMNSVSIIRLFIKVWLGLSLFAALYALKQEYIGFFQFELNNINNPLSSSLLFIDGRWRKFSIFADPVAFAYNMNVSTILCICLTFGPFSRKRKIQLIVMACLFYFTMLFSGTRAAYVLLPVAMAMVIILNLNLKMLIIGIVFVFSFLVMVFIPTSNYTIYRFQTAFRPSEDASYTVRAQNQKIIQPYIRSHPMGGGLGASGASGVRFSPGSFLAAFPPDSGFVRAAVEQGWIGLTLLCALFFTIVKTGINNFFRIRDPELKSYCLAMTAIVFALCVGNFPQEGLIQFPLNVYFCVFAAIVNLTWIIDQRLNPLTKKLNS